MLSLMKSQNLTANIYTQDAHDARADVAGLARVTLAGEKRGGEHELTEEEETAVPWELEACHTRINRLTAWCAQNGMKAI